VTSAEAGENLIGLNQLPTVGLFNPLLNLSDQFLPLKCPNFVVALDPFRDGKSIGGSLAASALISSTVMAAN
jgi:hypothetical protein